MSAAALHAVGVAGDPSSPVHRLDPRAKLLGLTGVTIVAVSAPALRSEKRMAIRYTVTCTTRHRPSRWYNPRA